MQGFCTALRDSATQFRKSLFAPHKLLAYILFPPEQTYVPMRLLIIPAPIAIIPIRGAMRIALIVKGGLRIPILRVGHPLIPHHELWRGDNPCSRHPRGHKGRTPVILSPASLMIHDTRGRLTIHIWPPVSVLLLVAPSRPPLGGRASTRALVGIIIISILTSFPFRRSIVHVWVPFV